MGIISGIISGGLRKAVWAERPEVYSKSNPLGIWEWSRKWKNKKNRVINFISIFCAL